MLNKQSYKLPTLPTGKFTSSNRRYFQEWKQIAKPIEKATGYKLYAFNPGFCFQRDSYKHIFSLSTFEAILLSKALKTGGY